MSLLRKDEPRNVALPPKVRDNVFTMLGATNHTEGERETLDYYATEPLATVLLLEQEKFAPTVWECACGGGHIAKVLTQYGYDVIATDIHYRGYGLTDSVDFLSQHFIPEGFDGDIITNPPYEKALEFCYRALGIVSEGHKVAMFLRLQFLEGKERRQFFEKYPPKTIYVASARLNCAKGGDFETYSVNGAIAYAWFVWVKGFIGDPVIKWIN